MVAISFTAMKDKLLTGEKTQTIRPFSERRYEQLRNAKKLQIYWKQRTKECRKLFDAEITEIFLVSFQELLNDYYNPQTRDRVLDLVRRDGFRDFYDMFDWFRKKYGKRLFDMGFMVIRFRRTN